MADNKDVNESSQTESTASAKQGRPKKYTDKEQSTIAAREQRKNARIRYKQNQTNYVSKSLTHIFLNKRIESIVLRERYNTL
ncbi:MAG: hypothetical protein EZS28_023184, partial [Streblomastix strix]